MSISSWSLRKILVAVLWKSALKLSSQSQKVKLTTVKVQKGALKNCNLLLDLNDGASFEMFEGIYDEFVFKIIDEAKVLQPGDHVWDIGANLGYHSLTMAKMVHPNGRIYAFEPNPYIANHLQRHLSLNPDFSEIIHLKKSAVSNQNGEAVLRCSSSYLMSSIGYLDYNGIPSDRISKSVYESLEAVNVQTITLDSILENNVEAPALIKIDVEGAEADVIAGGKHLLSTHMPALVIEVHNLRNMLCISQDLVELGYLLRYEDDPIHPSSSRGFLFASHKSMNVFQY